MSEGISNKIENEEKLGTDFTIQREEFKTNGEIKIDNENKNNEFQSLLSETIKKPLDLMVGIGGNEYQPNPRLFSYLIPAIEIAIAARIKIKEEYSNKINLILSTSLNGAIEYNARTPDEEKEIRYNTEKKLEFLSNFVNEFFPDTFNEISIFKGENHSNFNENVWKNLWEKIEKDISEEDLKALNYFSKNKTRGDLDSAKYYSVRHALWFKDIVLDSNDYIPEKNIISIGGHQEELFNKIRYLIQNIPQEELEEIFSVPVFVNKKVTRIITPTAGVTTYGEATRKRGKKRLSIECPFEINPNEHYSSNKNTQRLQPDINFTNKHVGRDAFLDFWKKCHENYKKINLTNK